ncbi:MAG: HAD-IA family hydrolase [Alphaproteobacteria bacterium]|jgi:phosphoglycolate phosphatase|nr:HAD-IA family hydrolase [Alphaproteobacteria bacterium]MDP7222914.1 HAD-IA family hydrolase [Alphaproteobacteria bacterium]
MISNKPTIILFDMDGTTVRHINPKLLHLLETLDDYCYKTGKFFSKLFKRKHKHVHLVEFRDGKRQKLLVHRAIHKFRRKTVDQIVEPCPGIHSLLDYLQDHNVRMGIISNGLGKGYGHDVLETFKLDDYYEVKIFREDIKRAKPHPDPIIHAINKMEPDVTENDVIWYIGDRHKDIEAAVAAAGHIPCEIEPFAYNINAALAILRHNFGPNNIIMSWADFEEKIRQILGGTAPSKTSRKSA